MTFDLPEGATAIEVESTTGSPGIPFFLVIDADDDDRREIVLVSASKDDDTFNLSTPDHRGMDGTADVAHTAGALCGVYPIAAHWTDINDRVDAVQSDVDLHNHDGVDAPQIPLTDIEGHTEAAHADFRAVGEIVGWPGDDIPARFLECNGQAVSRVTFADLFSVMGTKYGDGDGSSTFGLPNFNDAFPRGASATNAVGSSGGTTSHDHTNPTTDNGGDHAHTQGDTGSSEATSGTASVSGHAHTNPGTNAGGQHQHSQGRTANAGDHAHTNPSTGSSGSHAHTSAGGHSHSTGAASTTVGISTGTNDDAARHNHGHSLSSASNHSHGTDGSHAHSQGNTGSNGTHDHGLSNVNTSTSHAHSQGNTGSNGGHAHSITNSSHDHSNPSTNSVSGHNHEQTDTGTTTHMPPWLAMRWIVYAGV